MPKQLTEAEMNLINRMVGHEGANVREAYDAVNAKREKKGEEEIGYAAVCKFVKGDTHKRGAKETRGRPQKISFRDVKKLLAIRRKLIQEADNKDRVTYKDIVEEAALPSEPGERCVADGMRRAGCRWRPPKEKVYISEEDAPLRKAFAKEYKEKPAHFWTSKVHAFLDEKSFVLPLSPHQRKKHRTAQATGHLRLKSEGCDRGFTKAKTKHSSLGLPSVHVSCAIAKGRVVMWHYHEGRWSGNAAVDTYKALHKALKRTWP